MEQNVARGEFRDTLSIAPWVMIASGVFTLLFGILAILYPGVTLLALVVLFGVYALVDGVVQIAGAFTTKRYWPLLFVGALGIVAGIVTFAYPGLTTLVLYYIIAVWALLRGIAEIVAAFAEPMSSGSRWLLGFTGVLTVLFGILLISYPGAGIVSLAWFIGFFAIMAGVARIWFGLEVRSVGAHLRGAVQH